MPSSTLTAKGQTTIPIAVREHLHVVPGDRLEFFIKPDGGVEVRAATTKLAALRGILRRDGQPPVSVAEMTGAVRKRFESRR